MEKNRRFVGFFAFISTVLFSLNLWAAGYTCPTYTKFTSCGVGRYMTLNGVYNGTATVGNACKACPDGASCPGGTAAPRYTVTLDYNGGTTTSETLTTVYRAADITTGLLEDSSDTTGATVVDFADMIPTRAGYTFNGFTAEGIGEVIKANGNLADNFASFASGTGAVALVAQWSPCPAGSYCDGSTVTACPNGGKSAVGATTKTACYYEVKYIDSTLTPVNAVKTQKCYYDGSSKYVCDYLMTWSDLGWTQTKNGKYYAMSGWSLTSDASKVAHSLGQQDVGIPGVLTYLYMVWNECTPPNAVNGTVTVVGISDNTCKYNYACANGYWHLRHDAKNYGVISPFQCEECTNAPTNAKYTSGATTKTACLWDCKDCESSETGGSCTVSKGENSCTYTATCSGSNSVAYMNGLTPECVECPTNSTKTSESSCTCDTGYSKGAYIHDSDTIEAVEAATSTGCVADIYTVTYACGEGTGAEFTAEATYNSTFTPISDQGGCVKENFKFTGWKFDDDGKDVPASFQWLFTEDKRLVAQWEQDKVTCSEGFMEDGTECQDGYYCPEYAEAQRLTDDEDCAIKCPVADDLGVQMRDDTEVTVNSAVGATKRTQCMATYYQINLLEGDTIVGKANKSCYYSTESGDDGAYSKGACTTTPTSCVAGYYRKAPNATGCEIVPVGSFSADGDLEKTDCGSLAGAIEGKTLTEAQGSERATQCYKVCDNQNITNGTLVATGNKSFNGSEYPACEYTTVCEDNYTPNGSECLPNVYTIDYRLNGGENNPANPMSYTYVDTIELADPTRENSVFEGWYEDSDFTGDPITQIAKNSEGPKTFYAKWSCDVGYEDPDTNNQECVAKTSTITLSQDTATAFGTVEIYTKYDVGAYLDAAYTQPLTTGGEYYVTLPQQQYDVKYESGAEDVDLQKTSDTASSKFNGYYSLQTGGTQYIDADGYITSLGDDAAKASALYYQTGIWYAQWTPNVVTLPDAPERTGYTFAGWYDGTATFAAGAESNTITADVTFTAKWTPIKYTIVFESEDVNTTGTMAPQECEYDTPCTLNQNKFELENFGFAGWKDSADNPYVDEARVINLASTDGATVTMTAQWTQKFYDCEPGYASDNTQCADGYYCPDVTVPFADKDSDTLGCQRKCPADDAATSIASGAGASAPTQCYAAYEDVRVEHGSVNKSKCYYDDNAGKYSSGCNITVKTCDAGYYRVKDNATDCEIVPIGSFSAKDDLEKTDCGSLAGAIEGKTLTEAQGSERATQCYKVCDNQNITNGTLVATGNKSFNGSEYPACEYTTVCEDNYSPNGSECLPNVYKVNLNPASNNGELSVVYVKYSVGWFKDKDAYQELTSVVLPTETGRVCIGYSANNQTIIDESGQFITTTAVIADDTDAIAQWNDKDSVTCEPGTYYSVAQKDCVLCLEGNYCPNPIKVYPEDQTTDAGMYPCDTAEDAYTAATDANGNKLPVSISSTPGATSETQCYATNLEYKSSTNNATGAKTCRYNTTLKSYDKSVDCDAPKILTCTAGHYLRDDADTDCTETESGYYSAAKELYRHACPFLGTTGYTISTALGATQKGACYLEGAWSEPDNSHSGQRGDCYWNDDSAYSIEAYNTNCLKTIIVTCDAGYWDDKKEYDENASYKFCSQVQMPFYSPAQEAFCAPGDEECLQPTSAGQSTERYSCEGGGETKENGADSESDCYASVFCTVDGGGTGARTCAYNPETKQYDVCDAEHATACNVSECPTGYKLNSDGTACVAKTYPCEAGKYFDGANMKLCPENSYCDGTGDVTYGSEGCVTSCPTEYPNSVAGANSEGMCYGDCTMECVTPENCPDHFQSCRYVSETLSGIQYYGTSACVVEGDTNCKIDYEHDKTYCSSSYYMSDEGDCKACSELGDLWKDYSSMPNMERGPLACGGICTPECNVSANTIYDEQGMGVEVVDYCPEHATCVVGALPKSAYVWYPAEGCIPTTHCTFTFTCDKGYVPSDTGAVEFGQKKSKTATRYTLASPQVSCDPDTFDVTLDDVSGYGGSGAIRQTYTVGWFDLDGSEVTKVTMPVRQGYRFIGYFTGQNSLIANNVQVVGDDAKIIASPDLFTDNATIYAWWEPIVYTVTLNHNGGASDVDTIYQKYGIGWFDDAAVAEKNAITEIAIPTKTNSVFLGYFADDEENAVITAEGVLPANNTFNSDVELTAKWSDCPDAEFGANVATAELDGVVDNVCQYVHTCKVGYWNTNNNKAVASELIDCSACTAAKPDSADWNEDLFTADACTWTCKSCVAGNGVTSCDVTQTETTCDYSIVCNDNHIKTSDVHAYQTTCAACPEHSTADDGQDGCYCDDHYNGGKRVEIGGVCPADIYTITLNPGYADATDVKIYQKWLDAFYEDKDASQAIDSVSVLDRGSAYRFDGYFTQADDSQQDGATDAGTMVVDATGQIVANADFDGDTTWYAHWTGLTYNCEPGYYFEAKSDGSDSVKKPCYAPYYCDGTGVVTVGETGCISTCPALGWLGDFVNGVYTYQDNKPNNAIESCHKLTEDSAFEKGTALSDCYYTDGDRYATACSVVPLTCDAGYYYPSGSGASACFDAGNGYYSPKDALNRTACPLFEDLGEGKIGSANGRDEINDCYMVCDLTTDDVEHSVTLAPNNDREYYNDNQYNACSYTVSKCEDGYTPVSGTEPACNANTYNVTLYKFAGSDEEVDTVQCTFDSQNCVLPSTDQLVRAGYVSVAKWCDANGKCFDAGKNTTQNISANGTDIALYAQWESDVFAVQLVADDADINATQNPIYLKYNIGWYSDAEATQPFDGLTNLPEKDNGAYLFAGYKIGEKQIIGADGKTLDGTNTVVTDDATATVVWSKGTTVCAPGYYYPGNGNADNCQPCKTNHYCEGGNFGTDSGVAGGLIICPDNGMSDGGVNATSSAACYKTKLNYVAQYGAGTQTCFYKDGAYADRCKDIEITSCVGGYFYDEDETSVDCVEVGVDYYSVEGDMTKTQCPSNALITGITGDVTTAATVYECFATVAVGYAHGSGEKVCNYTSGTDNELIYNTDCRDYYINYCDAGYYRVADVVSDTVPDCVAVGMGNYSTLGDVDRYPCPEDEATGESGKTETDTAGSVAACYVNNTPYPADDYDKTPLHGGGYQTCFYTAETDKYDTNCGTPTFTYCDAGYYNDGIYVNVDGARDCTSVEDGYYSADKQLERKKCPNNGKTGKVDAADITECYLTDVACDILNGTGSQDICYYGDAEYSDCSECLVVSCDETYSQVGNMCVNCAENHFCTGGQEFSCDEETSGQYPLSQAGSTDVSECYRLCGMADNATEMSGAVYQDGTNTCEIVTCGAGYMLEDGKCVDCPAGSVCDGNGGGEGGDNQTCATLTGGTHTMSDNNNSSVDYCYRTCDMADNATEMSGRDYYTATDTCEIVTCDAGYMLENGVCVDCPAGSVCDGNGGGDTCATLTGGTHTMSDNNNSSVDYCYRTCDMADNATEMSGRDYYTATDTCKIETCGAGYMLEDGKCVDCPAGSVCGGNGPGDDKTCTELTGGTHTMSDSNNSSVDYCYRTCDMADNATEMSGRDYYTATDTCEIETCDAGYMLENGVCVDCPAGSVCDGNGGVQTCTALTGGKYPLSDANASDIGDCYKDCESTESATIVGRDYYDNSKHQDTCTIATCNPGYMPSDSGCVVCPEGSVCTGDPTGTKTCAELTNNTHIYSETKADNIDDCYTVCKSYDVVGGTAIPVNDIEFYPAECEYRGESDTGNPCDIVDGVCVETSCNYNYEMINGRCEPCNREHAITYKQGGNCVVESCVIGYHPYGQECAEDVAECAAPNAVAATQTWDVRTNAFGPCMITECESGYHLAENVCQLDEQVCELPHGVGMREWNHNSNRWGDCVATKCDPGYTNDPAQTNQLWEQCGECANKYSAYGQVAASSYVDECEIAACLYQGELYNLENNECVQICTTYSDETGSRRWNPDTRKCEHDCADGYMMW